MALRIAVLTRCQRRLSGAKQRMAPHDARRLTPKPVRRYTSRDRKRQRRDARGVCPLSPVPPQTPRTVPCSRAMSVASDRHSDPLLSRYVSARSGGDVRDVSRSSRIDSDAFGAAHESFLHARVRRNDGLTPAQVGGLDAPVVASTGDSACPALRALNLHVHYSKRITRCTRARSKLLRRPRRPPGRR